jgi:serine/threonine-protein kinase
MGEEPDTLETLCLDRVGKTLNEKWTLERLLGVGGVAAVYAARHRNGRRVAVKVLHPELAVDSRMKKRFLREGYVANKVEHPGAVVVLDDAVSGDGSVFLVMELLEGETLDARCRRLGGNISPADGLNLVHALLDIVRAAHAVGVLHRDITPSNVFVTTTGRVKLLDFGIARLHTKDSEPVTKSLAGALGTPGFMPPEQARGLWEEVDVRSDLWAVGAVLYRALAGRSVHQGRTPSEQLLAAMTQRAKSLAEVLEDAPEAVVALVDKAIQFEPAKRFQDAEEFRAEVGKTYADLVGDPIEEAKPLLVPPPENEALDLKNPTQPGFGTTVPLPTSQSRPWQRRAAITAGALAVVGVLGIWFFDRAPPQQTTAAPTPVSEQLPGTPPPASVTPAVTPPVAPRDSAPPLASSVPVRPKRPAVAPRVGPRPKSTPEDAVLDERK